jgi:hypothetical protein
MGALVFLQEKLTDCHSGADKLEIQIFSLGDRIHCEMETARGRSCCASMTPAEARRFAAAVNAAASFSDNVT